MSKDSDPKFFTEAEVKAMMVAATAPLLAKIEALELRIAKMQRDSSTSSKPPSSDITKPPTSGSGGSGGGKKLKPGGQPGHPKHEREFFKPDEIDQSWSYTVDDEEGLEPIAEDDPGEGAWRVVQQIEWAGRSLKIVEHRARRYRLQIPAESSWPRCPKVYVEASYSPQERLGLSPTSKVPAICPIAVSATSSWR